MSEKLCPNCRRPLQEMARFCTECGSRIDVFTMRRELDDSTLTESPADFEALKVLLEEESAEEEITEEAAEEDPETGITEITEEIEEVAEESAVKIEEVIEESAEIQDENIERIVSEIENNLVKTLQTENSDTTIVATKQNRIITSPVTGGFKKREPQAEEVKDLWTF